MSSTANSQYMGSSWVYYSEKCCIKRILRSSIPRQATRSHEVGIAGSCALHYFQDKKLIGPKWAVPNDIDIFVCGRYGRSKASFFRFVESVHKSIISSGHKTSKVVKKHMYAHRNRLVWIIDVTIVGYSSTLSFVQSPCPTVEESAKRFDIDVCQVVYHIHTESFWVSSDHVVRHIKDKTALVKPIMWNLFGIDDIGPGHFDSKKVCSTISRIQKYRKRGFRFKQADGVVFTSFVH